MIDQITYGPVVATGLIGWKTPASFAGPPRGGGPGDGQPPGGRTRSASRDRGGAGAVELEQIDAPRLVIRRHGRPRAAVRRWRSRSPVRCTTCVTSAGRTSTSSRATSSSAPPRASSTCRSPARSSAPQRSTTRSAPTRTWPRSSASPGSVGAPDPPATSGDWRRRCSTPLPATEPSPRATRSPVTASCGPQLVEARAASPGHPARGAEDPVRRASARPTDRPLRMSSLRLLEPVLARQPKARFAGFTTR